METKPAECNSEDGLTVGLIDVLITVANVLYQRLPHGLDPYPSAIQEALDDLQSNWSLHDLIGVSVEERLLFENHQGITYTDEIFLSSRPGLKEDEDFRESKAAGARDRIEFILEKKSLDPDYFIYGIQAREISNPRLEGRMVTSWDTKITKRAEEL